MMVRLTGGLVDLTTQGTEGRAIEDVIDTNDEGARLEGETEAIASLDEGILQPFTDLAPCIGQGGIIEVTADDDTLRAIALYELMDDIGLYTVGLEGRSELRIQGILQTKSLPTRGQAQVVFAIDSL